MWNYEKRLEYPVNITTPNPKICLLYTSLGLMMQWATQYNAHLNGAWWAYFPVILVIALISFSLNLMNTCLLYTSRCV